MDPSMTTRRDIYALLLEAVGTLDSNHADLLLEVGPNPSAAWGARVVDVAGAHVVQEAEATGSSGTAALGALAIALHIKLLERVAADTRLAADLHAWIGRDS